MNEKFFYLEEKKQNNIINASLEEFTNHGYRKASTDQIVKKAKISKGLLFYYFGSKKNLYLYLFDYSMKLFIELMDQDYHLEDKDFFKVIEYYMNLKIEIYLKHNHIYHFLMRAYMEDDPDLKVEIRSRNMQMISDKIGGILKEVDLSRFKEDIDIEKAMNTIIWAGKSYAQENILKGNNQYKELKQEFKEYLQFYKRCFYREEYITHEHD